MRGMGLKPLGRGLDYNLETARDLSEAGQKPATEYQRNSDPLTRLSRVCNPRSAARGMDGASAVLVMWRMLASFAYPSRLVLVELCR